MIGLHHCRHCGGWTRSKDGFCGRCRGLTTLDVVRERGTDAQTHDRLLDIVHTDETERLL